MKVVKSLLLLPILPWILGAATLHLKKREIRPEVGQPEVGQMVSLEGPGPRWTSGRSHLILQFRAPTDERVVQELNRRGAYVVGAVPDFGVAVSAPDDFSIAGLDVAWAGRLEIGDKISALLENSQNTEDIWLVAEFFPDVNMHEARRLAESAGFQVHDHPDLVKSHLLLSGSSARLQGLAQWDEVSYLFPASGALIRGEHVTNCAGALTTEGNMPMYSAPSSGWPKDANGQVTLSYVFGYLTPKLESSQATQAILSALRAWTPYAPITFVAGTNSTAAKTVYIWFATGDHGDGYPFDAAGSILAHTFYPAPPNAEPIAGDMHFDTAENWHIGANTDLYTVALHEAGHALGLAHVDDPAALMYPYYQLGSKIVANDIASIESIYSGSGGSTASGSTSGTPTAPVAPLTLAISTPAANSSTTASTVAVTGTTSGAEGTVQVTWQTNSGSSGAATGSTNWTAAAVPLILGSNTITVTAADSSRKTVETVSVTRTAATANPAPVDHTPPTLSITSPAGTVFNTSAATINVSGTASDSDGVTKVTWQNGSASGNATGATRWTASSIPLLVGSNTIMVRAYDNAGNMSWRSLLVIRN